MLDIVPGEHSLVPFKGFGIFVARRGVGCIKSLFQGCHAHGFGHFLYQNLDKDTARRRRFIFIHVHHRKAAPWHGIRMQQMRKEFGHVPQFVRFQPMDGIVLLLKGS
jgi:hypothetical protein